MIRIERDTFFAEVDGLEVTESSGEFIQTLVENMIQSFQFDVMQGPHLGDVDFALGEYAESQGWTVTKSVAEDDGADAVLIY